MVRVVSNEMLSLAWKTEVATSVMKCVLVALADIHNEKTNLCFPSITTLSRRTNMNRQSVINNIRKLEEAGLISVERNGGVGFGALSNRYTFQLGQSQSDRPPSDEAKYTKRTTSNDSKVYEVDPNCISEDFSNNKALSHAEKEEERPDCKKSIRSRA